MDKYEYNLKLDQMKSLYAEENYDAAAEVADTINWNKIKNVNALVKAGEVYEKAERYSDSRDILLLAYDRSPIGRTIIYRLAEVAIKMKDFDSAMQYYDEFVQIAPHDNLKYVLQYNIQKNQGAGYQDLIPILEEFKEQEYMEEWAYELAYLYHKAGKVDKCIDACDELILWFGDGPYVERALELKMLYQPLNKIQEEKYRKFRHDTDTIVEIDVNPTKFDTVNLQEEIAKGMQQIKNATEKSAVVDTMDSIKKIVEDIPYLQMAEEDIKQLEMEQRATNEEIDGSLKINFQELLEEESDGQISLVVDDATPVETQITGQMSIQDILDEWEKTKRAAEAALQEAEQKKLESAKARALQEAGDIMDRLNDVLPKLDAGVSPKELLEEEYLQNITEKDLPDDIKVYGEPSHVISAEPDVEPEVEPVPELEPAPEVEPIPEVEEVLPAINLEEDVESGEASIDSSLVELSVEPEVIPEIVQEIPVEEIPVEEIPEVSTEETSVAIEEAPEAIEEEILPAIDINEFMALEPEVVEVSTAEADADTPILKMAEEEVVVEAQAEAQAETKESMGETKKLPHIKVKQKTGRMPEIPVPEDLEKMEEKPKHKEIKSLSEEQRAVFSYFVPVKGMEDQLCRAINVLSGHLAGSSEMGTGNLIIQGEKGCGKTVLATSLIKALQKDGGQPSGRIGKIDAASLNEKDVQQMMRKVAGGCLIIEKAGEISRRTASSLSLLMQNDTAGTLIILEDTSSGIKSALSKDEKFASLFKERIKVPIFTNDELVQFARSYSNELGYEIEEMAVLALYNRISNIQRLDQATTLTEVKEIVDEAIEREAHGGLKKAFSILTAKRYTEDDKIVLTESNFEIK